MSKNQYFIAQIFILVICVILFAGYVIFMFQNPELTGTQVFIKKWQLFVGIMACVIISQVLRVKYYNKLFQ